MDSFSAHGDKNEMYDFIANQKSSVRQLFLVHGELETQKSFKYFLHDKGFNTIDIPSPGQEIDIKG
jgi:metallo-beta-lactamase family protein